MWQVQERMVLRGFVPKGWLVLHESWARLPYMTGFSYCIPTVNLLLHPNVQAYWPFHRESCRKNEFADAAESQDPKLAGWMRKHGVGGNSFCSSSVLAAPRTACRQMPKLNQKQKLYISAPAIESHAEFSSC